MNIETQMVINRINADMIKVDSIEEIKKFVDQARPLIFGFNKNNQWSWRLAREQINQVDWEEILKWV